MATSPTTMLNPVSGLPTKVEVVSVAYQGWVKTILELLGDERQEQVPSEQAAYEEQSVQVEATAQRASVGRQVSSWASCWLDVLIGCSGDLELSDYDPNDLDGRYRQRCFDGFDEWTYDESLDHDRDGCHDGDRQRYGSRRCRCLSNGYRLVANG